MSYDHPLPPGNFATAVPQYRAKSGLRSPSRPNTARSYAEDTWPGVSYPSGDRTCVSRAPRERALACIRVAVLCQPPFSEARTSTASFPELRKTPRHRSAIRYVCPSATPTLLLPGPMSSNSRSLTVCSMSAGRAGSTVRANRVLSVLAGGSARCASCAASTSPVRASATSQDNAETSGTPGTPRWARTWVPWRYRNDGCGVARGAPGGVGSAPAAAATGASARTPATQRAQMATAVLGLNSVII